MIQNNDHKISVRVNKKDWIEFKEETNELGLSASDVIRLFIKKFNENPKKIKLLFE